MLMEGALVQEQLPGEEPRAFVAIEIPGGIGGRRVRNVMGDLETLSTAGARGPPSASWYMGLARLVLTFQNQCLHSAAGLPPKRPLALRLRLAAGLPFRGEPDISGSLHSVGPSAKNLSRFGQPPDLCRGEGCAS